MRQFWNIDILVAKMKTMAFREPHTDTFVSFFDFLKKTCLDFFLYAFVCGGMACQFSALGDHGHPIP